MTINTLHRYFILSENDRSLTSVSMWIVGKNSIADGSNL